MKKAKKRKWTAWENSKIEKDICLNCPLSECVALEKGCERLNAELKKLKEKE